MINPFCNPLNLTIPPLSEKFDPKTITNEYASPDLSYVHPDMTEWLSQFGVSVYRIDFFHKLPREPLSEIHIDGVKGDRAKINWVYGGKNSKMIWYEPLVLEEKSFSQTIAGGNYTSYKLHEVREIYSNELLKPSLVQAGEPHAIYNPTEERICISLALKKNNKQVTMAEACEIFKDILIN